MFQWNLIYKNRWVGFGQQAILYRSLFYTLVIQSTELDPDRLRPWFSHLPAVRLQREWVTSLFHFPCVKLRMLRPPGNRETIKTTDKCPPIRAAPGLVNSIILVPGSLDLVLPDLVYLLWISGLPLIVTKWLPQHLLAFIHLQNA